MERRKVYAILLLFVIPALAYGNLANNPSMEGNFIYQAGWDVAEYWTSWPEPGGGPYPTPDLDEGSYAHDGTKSQEISCLLLGISGKIPRFGPVGIYQQITSLQPGAIYRASVWFKFQFSATGGSGAGIRVSVGTDPNGATDPDVVSDWSSVSDSDGGTSYQGPWKNVVLFFSPNTPSATLFIGASGHFLAIRPHYGCWSDCYIDDVNVQLIQIIPPVDIKPGSCPNPLNVDSKGVLPVAILGTGDFDVNTIDIASIRLEGVAAIRSSYEDVETPVLDGNECDCNTAGPDGYADLTLKFDTEEIVGALGDVNDGDVLPLTLTGALDEEHCEVPIEGSDCIVVIGKVPRWIKAKKSDVNEDGVIDLQDFCLIAEYWLEASAE